MTATIILWGHALAALLFGALALASWRQDAAPLRRVSAVPHAALATALALTALWALAVAGIEPDDVSTQIARAARSLAWLHVIVLLARARGGAGRSMTALALLAALVLLGDMVLAVLGGSEPGRALAVTRALLAAVGAAGACLLLSHVAGQRGRDTGALRLLTLGLALIWGGDLIAAAATVLQPAMLGEVIALRGPVMVAVALLLAAAGADRGVSGPALSRPLAMRLIVLSAVIAYAGFIVLLASGAAVLAGVHARAAQTAVVFGATAALLAFVSTPWLRAWMRVKVAKHLFGHRYDYRSEWQRFTATLGVPGEGADPLGTRIVKALADITDSPAGLLLTCAGEGLAEAAAWRWPGEPKERGAEAAFARHLAQTGRILSLDELRGDAGAPEWQVVPHWLAGDPDAWAVVPLPHGERLTGAIILSRPPVDRALDWEDFDLLRIAGRQAASYLAEDRAHAALAEARRFDEFNRRFAFLIHDIKNVASQLTLVARNAERHADNPAFRADMVATLRDSAGRMTTLLARLGQHDGARPETARPVDLAELALRLATVRRAQHPVEIIDQGRAFALAQPQRLEQALGHLLQNAAEASAPGAPVTLLVGGGDDGRPRIAVRDTGCGMSAAFVRDQLFRPFASSKPAGFGIGAYEARQLVQAMGGTLEVDSREGAGSCFTILLPAAPADTGSLENAA
ncbi:hypothetical protein GCM10011380_07290 [Sphingomonas metalli]|uniref:histidine kinase n=1 Tax=Sphingomonas metalli TaxID=1779358 RepID=A0A916SZ60_9SPHN|nr:XrtA/PEP-CTERM system histidine kinase PrsK [Sphingomonas metalli]GGB20246.1 hypothetical protein GCM10011380_07290 [Sphingomonas metalli]